MEIDVKHVAELAKISLSAEELADLGKDLAGILEHVGRLAGVDVAGVSPTFGPAKSAVLLPGDDVPRRCLSRDAALALFPETKDGNLLVPREGPDKEER